jgi:hypothetical protein
LATAATADLGIVPPQTEGLLWSPDGRRLAYSAESDLRITPAEGGPPFTVCRIPGSGRLTKGWWHDDGTIYFAVWRESLYRVPASGGTPARVTAIAPETEIDFHSVAVLPDGRLIVTTHLRGQDGCAWIVTVARRRRSLTIPTSTSSGSAPNELLFVRVRRNPGVGQPFGAADRSTRSTSKPARLPRLRRRTRAFRPARERRELVGRARSAPRAGANSTRLIATMPGAPFEAALLSIALSPDGGGVFHSRR